MSYDYTTERPEIFTESGVEYLRKIEANANRLLKDAGAFTYDAATKGVTGSAWTHMACLDYLCEQGKLVKCYGEGRSGWAQHQVYAAAG